jgi:hypothetical protein
MKSIRVVLANTMCRTPLGGGHEIFSIGGGSRWPFSYEAPVNDKPGYLPFPFELGFAAALFEKEPGIELFVRDCIANATLNQAFCKWFSTSSQTWWSLKRRWSSWKVIFGWPASSGSKSPT